jgi:hypothetical protein
MSVILRFLWLIASVIPALFVLGIAFLALAELVAWLRPNPPVFLSWLGLIAFALSFVAIAYGLWVTLPQISQRSRIISIGLGWGGVILLAFISIWQTGHHEYKRDEYSRILTGCEALYETQRLPIFPWEPRARQPRYQCRAIPSWGTVYLTSRKSL